MLFVLLLAPPLVASLIALAVRPYRRIVGQVNALLSLTSVFAAAWLWRDAVGGAVVTVGAGAFFRADALSALLAACVSFVTALAVWLGPGLGPDADLDARQVRRFRVFANAFAFTMLAAVTTNNLAFMWIAIEATTIASAILIPLRPTKAAIEASWKYILLGSVGIALAFAGTVLAYFDFINSGAAPESALNWTDLMAAAPSLHAEVIRLSFVFVLVGYGTKAGLAPMHTWLPDAHSEAPAPLSAMMSGVLLAVAVYAIVRWTTVVNAALGPVFSARLLVTLGVLSVAIGVFSLVVQRNYKRLLAYSSIEHTGLICVGLALGPLGVFAAMLHLLNHTLAKSTMFFLAGRVLGRYKTTDMTRVSGLLDAMPWTAGLFAAGAGLDLIGTVEAAVGDFEEIVDISLTNTLVMDRLEGTGRLSNRTARDYGTLGFVARASGIDADVRRDCPFAAYGDLRFRVPVHESGDVKARTLVRVEEVRESVALIRQALTAMPVGKLSADLMAMPAYEPAFSLVEGWRGAIFHWVMGDGAGRLCRVKIVDPSFLNWPSLSYALLENVVPDFPLCNKSYNQSYSGNDL